MIVALLITIYVVLGLTCILALAFAARATPPKRDCETELLQLMLRTELRSKPANWRMDEAA